MCYALNQRSYCRIYVFKLDISFFLFITILCVHVSWWMCIIMMVVYLQTYTRERIYMSYWYPNALVSILLFLFTFGGSEKNLPYECLVYFITSPALLFIKVFLTLMLALVSMLIYICNDGVISLASLFTTY